MLYMAGDNNLSEEMVNQLPGIIADEENLLEDAFVAHFDPGGTGLETQRYNFKDANKSRKPHEYLDSEFIPWEPMRATRIHFGILFCGPKIKIPVPKTDS